MRLRQKYWISGKPPSIPLASVLSDKLNKEAGEDVDALTDYLSERGTSIRFHRTPPDKFNCHGVQIPTGTTYYHMNDGLTVSVSVSAYGKDWLIKKEHLYLPKEIDVMVDIFGKGSSKLRQDIRKNVFGKVNQVVVKGN